MIASLQLCEKDLGDSTGLQRDSSCIHKHVPSLCLCLDGNRTSAFSPSVTAQFQIHAASHVAVSSIKGSCSSERTVEMASQAVSPCCISH